MQNKLCYNVILMQNNSLYLQQVVSHNSPFTPSFPLFGIVSQFIGIGLDMCVFVCVCVFVFVFVCFFVFVGMCVAKL